MDRQRDTDVPECGTSVASLTKIKIAVVRMGGIAPHLYKSLFTMLSDVRCVRIADIAELRAPQYQADDSSFALSMTRGVFDLEYVSDTQVNPYSNLFASKKVSAIFILVHARAQSATELAAILKQFKELQKEYQQAVCFLINPTEQTQAQNIDPAIVKSVRFIPMQNIDRTRGVMLVLVHEFLSGYVQNIHHIMTTPGARAGVALTTHFDTAPGGHARSPSGLSSAGSSPALGSGASASALSTALGNFAGDSRNRREDRNAARLLKWFGDCCMQLSDFKSAQSYYRSAISALEKVGDALWQAAALECLACSVFFHRVSFFAGVGTPSSEQAANTEYTSDEQWMLVVVEKYSDALLLYEGAGCDTLYVEAGIRLATLLILLNQNRQQVINVVFAVEEKTVHLHDRNMVLIRLAKLCIAIGCRRRAVYLLREAGKNAETRQNWSQALAAYVPALRLTHVPLSLNGARFKMHGAEEEEKIPLKCDEKSPRGCRTQVAFEEKKEEGGARLERRASSVVGGRLLRGERASLSCANLKEHSPLSQTQSPTQVQAQMAQTQSQMPLSRGGLAAQSSPNLLRPPPAAWSSTSPSASHLDDDDMGNTLSRTASASVLLGNVNFSLSSTVVSAIAKNAGSSKTQNLSLYEMVLEGLNNAGGAYGGAGQASNYYQSTSEFYKGSGGSGGNGNEDVEATDKTFPQVGTQKGWDVVQYILLKHVIAVTCKIAETLKNPILLHQVTMHTMSAYSHIAEGNFLVKSLHSLSELTAECKFVNTNDAALMTSASSAATKNSQKSYNLSPTFGVTLRILPLPPHLAPMLHEVQKGKGTSVFSFNPYLLKKKSHSNLMWVAGETGQLQVSLHSTVGLDLLACRVGVRIEGETDTGKRTYGLVAGRVFSRQNVAIPARSSTDPTVGIQPAHPGKLTVTHVEVTLEMESRELPQILLKVVPPLVINVSRRLSLLHCCLKGSREHLVDLQLTTGQSVYLTLVLTNAGMIDIQELCMELPRGEAYNVMCDAAQIEDMLPLKPGKAIEVEVAVTAKPAYTQASTQQLIFPKRPDFKHYPESHAERRHGSTSASSPHITPPRRHSASTHADKPPDPALLDIYTPVLKRDGEKAFFISDVPPKVKHVLGARGTDTVVLKKKKKLAVAVEVPEVVPPKPWEVFCTPFKADRGGEGEDGGSAAKPPPCPTSPTPPPVHPTLPGKEEKYSCVTYATPLPKVDTEAPKEQTRSTQRVDSIKIVYGQKVDGDAPTLLATEKMDTIDSAWDTYATPMRSLTLPLATVVSEGLLVVSCVMTECCRFYVLRILNKSKRIFNILNSPYTSHKVRRSSAVTPFVLPKTLTVSKDARLVANCPLEYQPAPMKITILPAATPTSLLVPVLQFEGESGAGFEKTQKLILDSLFLPWVTYVGGKPVEGVVPVNAAGLAHEREMALRATHPPHSPERFENFFMKRRGSFTADIGTMTPAGEHLTLTSPPCDPLRPHECNGDCLSMAVSIMPEGGKGEQTTLSTSTFTKPASLALPIRVRHVVKVTPKCSSEFVHGGSNATELQVGFAQHGTRDGSIAPAFLSESVFIEGDMHFSCTGDTPMTFTLSLHTPGETLLQVRVVSQSPLGPVAHVHTFPLNCVHTDTDNTPRAIKV